MLMQPLPSLIELDLRQYIRPASRQVVITTHWHLCATGTGRQAHVAVVRGLLGPVARTGGRNGVQFRGEAAAKFNVKPSLKRQRRSTVRSAVAQATGSTGSATLGRSLPLAACC